MVTFQFVASVLLDALRTCDPESLAVTSTGVRAAHTSAGLLRLVARVTAISPNP